MCLGRQLRKWDETQNTQRWAKEVTWLYQRTPVTKNSLGKCYHFYDKNDQDLSPDIQGLNALKY